MSVLRDSFPLLESKLTPTPARAGTIPRAALVNKLRAARGVTVAVVSAPAGYGKTTLLAEWERRDERPFAWLSLDEAENDPTVFLTYVAAALDRVQALDPDVFEALSGSRSSLQNIVARLGQSLASLRAPIVVALDDVHVLHAPACIDALAVLIEQLPAGSQLVLASRTAPRLPLGRLRAEGRVLEVGPGDLSLNVREAQALLAGAGLKLAGHEVEALTRSTEGWPAGLYLAALSLRDVEGRSPVRRRHSGRRPLHQRLLPPRPAREPARGRDRVSHARLGPRPHVRLALRPRAGAARTPRSSSSATNDRTSSSSRSTTSGGGIGSTTSSATCSRTSSSGASPGWQRA